MASLTIRPEALRDLDNIGDYTFSKWGEEQETLYLGQINEAFGLLSQKPHLGRSCDSIRMGYRRYTAGVHVIFYKIVDGGVEVVRVLHPSMDLTTHLSETDW